MKNALALLLLACAAWCTSAHAEVFRCTLPGGKVVYQEMACAVVPGAKERETAWSKEREADQRERAKREAYAKQQAEDDLRDQTAKILEESDSVESVVKRPRRAIRQSNSTYNSD